MNTKYYLDKFLRARFSYATAYNATSLFSGKSSKVIELPLHPHASEVNKWRIVNVNNVYALYGRVWREFPVNGKCWTWHEFAIAKDKDVLRVWKDLNCM